MAADDVPMARAPKSWLPGATASAAGRAVKVAVMVLVAASSGTSQVVPLQPACDQLVKVKFGSGTAVSVTGDALKDAVQVAPQLMPPGVEVTVPLPTLVTVTEAVPVPDSVAVASLPGVGWMTSVALLAPTAVGLNWTP